MLYSLFIESFGVVAREHVEALEAAREGDQEALKQVVRSLVVEFKQDL